MVRPRSDTDSEVSDQSLYCLQSSSSFCLIGCGLCSELRTRLYCGKKKEVGIFRPKDSPMIMFKGSTKKKDYVSL